MFWKKSVEKQLQDEIEFLHQQMDTDKKYCADIQLKVKSADYYVKGLEIALEYFERLPNVRD